MLFWLIFFLQNTEATFTLRWRNLVRPTVYTSPSRKQSFRKCSSNRKNLKTLALCFVAGKHFEDEALRKRWRHDNHVISLTEVYSNSNPNWPVIVTFLNSSGVVWTENIWCVFRVKRSVLNSSGVVWTENIWCVFRVKRSVLNSSGVVWTENIWCVFRVKRSVLNSSGVVWTENIWCVFRVKRSVLNSSGVVWTGRGT